MDGEKNNGTFNLDEIMNGDYTSDEVFSLESILSEYKSSAFIEGERKTPSQLLDEQVNEILKEVSGAKRDERPSTSLSDVPRINYSEVETEAESELDYKSVTDENDGYKPEHEERITEVQEKHHFLKKKKPVQKKQNIQAFSSPDQEETIIVRKEEKPANAEFENPFEFEQFSKPQETTDRAAINEIIDDDDDRYFESMEFADKIAKNVENPDWDFPGDSFDDIANNEEETYDSESFLGRFFSKFRKSTTEEYDDIFDTEDGEEEEYEEEEPDPDFSEEISRLSSRIPSLRLRTYITGALCVVMIIFTHMFESGKLLPFGIGDNFMVTSGVLLIMQLIAMMLGIDLLISGLENLLCVEPGVESLVLISCVITFVDGFLMLVNKKADLGIPFSVVSVGSLFFAMWSRKSCYKAMCDSLKMAIASNSPYGVINETEILEDREVLKKIPGKTTGFYKNLISQDVSENLYFYVTPLIIVITFIFAFLASVGSGEGKNFAHCYAVIMSVAVAFPAASAFILPFSYAVSRIKKNGCAIAGWCGVCDIYDADAALITDEDVFPVGSVSLSGIKLFEGVSQQKAIIYSSSLIINSCSGISKIFAELLRSQGFKPKPVEAFACYEGGGIGGVVEGERVLVGSGAFMNLMGIRVPEKVNVTNTIFAAVNDELAAVFTVNYVPANSVHSALEALLNTKTDVLLAVKDFNVTPNTIQKKFKVSMEGVEYLPIETSYKLAENKDIDDKSVSAILCREGLAPLSEVITKGRSVKTITELNTVISLIGTVIGVLLMFFLCKTSSFTSATAENTFIFMCAVEFCVILLSQLVKKRT